jgi:hypothetical protein
MSKIKNLLISLFCLFCVEFSYADDLEKWREKAFQCLIRNTTKSGFRAVLLNIEEWRIVRSHCGFNCDRYVQNKLYYEQKINQSSANEQQKCESSLNALPPVDRDEILNAYHNYLLEKFYQNL